MPAASRQLVQVHRRPPRETPRTASGARSSISRAECGSITALVSAWGVPVVRTSVWQTAWCTAIPVEPEA